MPAPNLGTLFMVLMTSMYRRNAAADAPPVLVGWETPEVLRNFKISAPSRAPNDPIPNGLTEAQSVQVAEYIEYIKGKPTRDKVDMLEYSQEMAVQRQAYSQWFPKIAKTINIHVDSVLMDLGLHPIQVVQQQEDDTMPLISVLASRAAPEAGPLIFGQAIANGTLCNNGALGHVQSFLVHTLTRLKKERARMEKFINQENSAGEKLREVYSGLKDETEVPTAKVRRAIPLLRQVRLARSWFPNTTEEILGEIEEFFIGLLETQIGDKTTERVHIRAPKSPVARSKLTAARQKGAKARLVPADVNDENDIQRTLDELVDHFRQCEQLEFPITPDANRLWEWFDRDGEDMGVTEYKEKSREELEELLDFKGSLPLLFNKFHCKNNTSATAWDAGEGDERWEKGGDGTMECKLGWHQLVCTAALADHTFGEKKPREQKSVTNMLLADDVGVGKTAEVMAYLAFLMTVWVSEENKDKVGGKGRPPIVVTDDKKLFMGRGPIPNLPHLLLVPNALVDQWTQEMKTFFKKGTIEIYRIPHIESDFEGYFTDPAGDWIKSKTPFIFRILLCTASSFHFLTNSRFETVKVSRNNPPDADRKVQATSADRRITLFSMDFCSFVVDEIHEFRGDRSKNFIGAVAVAKRAVVVIGCTATPLHSNPVDIVNIARILRIPSLVDQEGRTFVNSHQNKIKSAQNKLGANRQHALGDMEKAMRAGIDLGDSDPTREVKELRYSMVRELQAKIGHCIIRRTRESKKPDGSKISDVPPKKVIPFIVVLPQWELDLLNSIFGLVTTETTSLRRVGSGDSAIEIHMESFLTPYRTTLACPHQPESVGEHADVEESARARRRKKRALVTDWPVYKSIEHFDNSAGAKLKALVKLLLYHLSDDRAGPITEWDEQNGEMLFPPLPEASVTGERPRHRKIIVYFSFSMMRETIKSALAVHKIKVYCVTGALPQNKRDPIIESWKIDPQSCVLSFSNVAATGLNMTEASIVIHYDVSWSGVFQAQIDGRAWRYGQTKEVLVYHLLARGTTDIIMNGNALEKHSMMGALLKRDESKYLMGVLSGDMSHNLDESGDEGEFEPEEEEEEDNIGAHHKPKKRKAKAKAPKGNPKKKQVSLKGKEREVIDDAMQEGADEEMKKLKGKKRAINDDDDSEHPQKKCKTVPGLTAEANNPKPSQPKLSNSGKPHSRNTIVAPSIWDPSPQAVTGADPQLESGATSTSTTGSRASPSSRAAVHPIAVDSAISSPRLAHHSGVDGQPTSPTATTPFSGQLPSETNATPVQHDTCMRSPPRARLPSDDVPRICEGLQTPPAKQGSDQAFCDLFGSPIQVDHEHGSFPEFPLSQASQQVTVPLSSSELVRTTSATLGPPIQLSTAVQSPKPRESSRLPEKPGTLERISQDGVAQALNRRVEPSDKDSEDEVLIIGDVQRAAGSRKKRGDWAVQRGGKAKQSSLWKLGEDGILEIESSEESDQDDLTAGWERNWTCHQPEASISPKPLPESSKASGVNLFRVSRPSLAPSSSSQTISTTRRDTWARVRRDGAIQTNRRREASDDETMTFGDEDDHPPLGPRENRIGRPTTATGETNRRLESSNAALSSIRQQLSRSGAPRPNALLDEPCAPYTQAGPTRPSPFPLSRSNIPYAPTFRSEEQAEFRTIDFRVHQRGRGNRGRSNFQIHGR